MILSEQPPEKVTLVAVGEAPGKDEEQEGKLFVGRAGQLLREILERESVLSETHFTNTSFWRPPRTGNAGPDERPGIATVRAQKPRLLYELAVTRPRAIIALGKTAAEALIPGSFRRGVVENVRVAGVDIPVFATWHPAYIFREPKFYSDIVRDVQRAKDLEVPREADGSYTLTKEPVVFKGKYLFLDIETTNTHSSSDILCVAVRDDERTYLFTPEGFLALEQSLKGFRGRVVAHNGKFDESLLRGHGVQVKIHHDTMLLHLALDNRRGTHALKVLSPVYGHRKLLEHTVTPIEGAENVWHETPLETLYTYCAGDVVGTRDVFFNLVGLSDKQEKRLYKFLVRAARPIAEGEQRGILVDQEALSEAIKEQRKKVMVLHDSFGAVDPDSPKQVVEELQRLGYAVSSSAEGVLQRIAGEFPERMLSYRAENKVFTAFLEPLQKQWIAEDGACHPQTLIHGTDTGRTSMESPNLQQQPPELRGFFVPRPGHTFVAWDLRANEVRCLAVLTGDEHLIDLLNAGKDPHQTVADVLGVPRKTAKNFLFGTVYKAGYKRLAVVGGVDIETAKRGVAKIREMFPKLPQWQEKVTQEAWEQGYILTPFHRRLAFPYSDDLVQFKIERQICNAPVQSMGSDIGLTSVIRAWELAGLPTLAFVHDSCLVEVETDSLSTYVRNLKEILTDLYPNEYGVRFEVDLRQGSNWRDLCAI